jgi:hypothetical protein
MSPKPQPSDYSSQLLASQDFFARSTRVLEEADSTFRPQEGMMTVAQQVAHTAQIGSSKAHPGPKASTSISRNTPRPSMP